MRYILNSAVITSPGCYIYNLITPDEAREWIKQGPFLSTIGYQETAKVLSEMLGIEIQVNRITIQMQKDDEALVFRIVLPPGHPRIDPANKGQIQNILGSGFFELGLLKKVW